MKMYRFWVNTSIALIFSGCSTIFANDICNFGDAFKNEINIQTIQRGCSEVDWLNFFEKVAARCLDKEQVTNIEQIISDHSWVDKIKNSESIRILVNRYLVQNKLDTKLLLEIYQRIKIYLELEAANASVNDPIYNDFGGIIGYLNSYYDDKEAVLIALATAVYHQYMELDHRVLQENDLLKLVNMLNNQESNYGTQELRVIVKHVEEVIVKSSKDDLQQFVNNGGFSRKPYKNLNGLGKARLILANLKDNTTNLDKISEVEKKLLSNNLKKLELLGEVEELQRLVSEMYYPQLKKLKGFPGQLQVLIDKELEERNKGKENILGKKKIEIKDLESLWKAMSKASKTDEKGQDGKVRCANGQCYLREAMLYYEDLFRPQIDANDLQNCVHDLADKIVVAHNRFILQNANRYLKDKYCAENDQNEQLRDIFVSWINNSITRDENGNLKLHLGEDYEKALVEYRITRNENLDYELSVENVVEDVKKNAENLEIDVNLNGTLNNVTTLNDTLNDTLSNNDGFGEKFVSVVSKGGKIGLKIVEAVVFLDICRTGICPTPENSLVAKGGRALRRGAIQLWNKTVHLLDGDKQESNDNNGLDSISDD